MEAYVEKSLKRLKASHFNSIWGAVPFSKLIDKVKKYDMKIIVGAVPGRETIVKDSEKLKINIPAPALKTVYAKIPPNIDGKLEDPCWKNACAINKFILLNATDMAGQKTEAFVLYDEKNLYIALRCYDSRINKISKLYAKHDDPIWKDDSVEIFIDIDHTKKDYFQLAVNAIGAKLDTKWESGKSDIKWNAENWKAISFIGPDFWSVEMTVPLKSLSSKPIKKDTVWGFNIARSARSHAEYSSWAPLYHNFIQPGMFGVLTFDDKIQNKRSSGSVSGKVINTAGKPVENAIVTAGRFVTLTNSKGEFSFESLPEGECVISAGGYNYEPVSGGVVVNKNGVVLPPFILENAMHLTLSPSKTYDLVKENIDALKNNKNSILGYYMADEPPVCAADNLALVNRFYKSFDSDIPALSCFLGLPAIKLLCQKVKPSVLLIDVYPLREDSPVGDLKMRGHHLPEMDMTEYIDKARDCLPGRPLWVAVQAFGSAMNGKPHFRLPEPVEIRAMVYSAIAHGAKGIIYFLYESKKAGAKKGESLIGLIGPDGKATPNWKEVGRINKELNFLSPLLLNLNIRKNIASASENADVQTFCDSENNIYLILVNRDVTAAKEISVKIENEKLGGFSQIIEFVGKNKISHNLQDNHIVFKALLDPGDGKVFQLIKTAK
jgi:hypothetical protein